MSNNHRILESAATKVLGASLRPESAQGVGQPHDPLAQSR